MAGRDLSEQERFWAGEFGKDYIERNRGDIAARTALFAQVLRATRDVASVVELGANIGLNLHALRVLLPKADLAAVEINADAVGELRKNSWLDVTHGSLLDFQPGKSYDLSFTSGVLIHIAPELLPQAYDALYRASGRYVLVAEYYDPSPVEIPYRGHSGKLFKRDFAGEIIDRHDMALVDYGFVWRRDPVFALGDINWFLLEKRR